MSSKLSLENTVPLSSSGHRLDQVVAALFPEYSRSKLQGWIKTGELTVDGAICKPKRKVSGGEHVRIEAQYEAEGAWESEAIDFNVVYEDSYILVIHKPAGLVVHPAVGNWSGTLLNGLLHHDETLRELPRAGIVHRLDKDTSGLMVVAKTLEAQTSLVSQLQNRSVSRIYRALVHGELKGKGIVEADIGRHPTHRTKMAVVNHGGKFARTHYRTLKTFIGFTYVELKLDSGRTHQIRVHMSHLGFPLVGDPVYGKKLTHSQTSKSALLQVIDSFERQALHAKKLGLIHPKSLNMCEWEIEMAEDINELLSFLSTDS